MVYFNSNVSIADGVPLVGMAWLAGFQIREQVVGSWMFRALRGDRVLSMSMCFFGGPEEMTERTWQRLDIERGSALAFHEEPR